MKIKNNGADDGEMSFGVNRSRIPDDRSGGNEKKKSSKSTVARDPGPGLSRRPWLTDFASQAKASARPATWPGLARPKKAWLGLASGLRPGHAHH